MKIISIHLFEKIGRFWTSHMLLLIQIHCPLTPQGLSFLICKMHKIMPVSQICEPPCDNSQQSSPKTFWWALLALSMKLADSISRPILKNNMVVSKSYLLNKWSTSTVFLQWSLRRPMSYYAQHPGHSTDLHRVSTQYKSVEWALIT